MRCVLSASCLNAYLHCGELNTVRITRTDSREFAAVHILQFDIRASRKFYCTVEHETDSSVFFFSFFLSDIKQKSIERSRRSCFLFDCEIIQTHCRTNRLNKDGIMEIFWTSSSLFPAVLLSFISARILALPFRARHAILEYSYIEFQRYIWSNRLIASCTTLPRTSEQCSEANSTAVAIIPSQIDDIDGRLTIQIRYKYEYIFYRTGNFSLNVHGLR